jgi:hypothetical protein
MHAPFAMQALFHDEETIYNETLSLSHRLTAFCLDSKCYCYEMQACLMLSSAVVCVFVYQHDNVKKYQTY